MLNKLFPLSYQKSYSTIIVDANGELLYSFLSKDDKWRMYATSEEISEELKKAIIHKEDKYFYYHFGVNPVAIARAFFYNIIKQKRTSGASTINMQVARLLEPKKRNYTNKLVEVFRAIQLEWYLSKDEILQLYLNLVPYGGNIEGVKAAAILYFNKAPNHLSLGEITALSVIPNRPSSLQIGKHNDLIEKARNKWLLRFKKDEVFSDEIIDDAISEPFSAQRFSAPKIAPHLAFRLKQEYPEKKIIKTTITKESQQTTENIVSLYMNRLKPYDIHNAAVLIVNNETNQIVSYIGSADFYSNLDAGQVDGVRAIRQPGSTLKPLIYAMAFDKGMVTPKSILTDVPVNYSGYSPVNFNQEFNGYVTTEEALAKSLNIPAVKVLHDVGVENVVDVLIKARFQTIQKQQESLGLSLVLGGCGVNLEEITALYASLQRGGIYIKPSILKESNTTDSTKLISKEASFMTSEIMTKLERVDFPSSWKNVKNMPNIAWKTGTSYGRRDAWSIGYNEQYTIGVWVGNFSGKGVPELTGAETASPLLFSLFNALDKAQNKNWLTAPDGLSFRLVCPKSGLLPSTMCEETVMDYFMPGISSNSTCSHLQQYYVSENDSFSYCMNCLPIAGYKTLWLPHHPIEIQAYFQQQHLSYETLPKHNPSCTSFSNFEAPQIISPSNGNTYYIVRDEPESLVLNANTSNDVRKVFWYINNQFFKEANSKESVLFLPKKNGSYKISCSDDKARNSDIYIEVKLIE